MLFWMFDSTKKIKVTTLYLTNQIFLIILRKKSELRDINAVDYSLHLAILFCF